MVRDRKLDHINVLELKAVLLGIQSLCGANEYVHVYTDNTTAMAYVVQEPRA